MGGFYGGGGGALTDLALALMAGMGTLIALSPLGVGLGLVVGAIVALLFYGVTQWAG